MRRDVVGRRWRRRREEAGEDPLSTDDGRGSLRSRGQGQERALGQNPAALSIAGQVHPLEISSKCSLQTVEPSQTLIHVGELRVDEVEEAHVAGGELAHELRRLRLERALQRGVVGWEHLGSGVLKSAKPERFEPEAREARIECLCLRISPEPCHLLGEPRPCSTRHSPILRAQVSELSEQTKSNGREGLEAASALSTKRSARPNKLEARAGSTLSAAALLSNAPSPEFAAAPSIRYGSYHPISRAPCCRTRLDSAASYAERHAACSGAARGSTRSGSCGCPS